VSGVMCLFIPKLHNKKMGRIIIYYHVNTIGIEYNWTRKLSKDYPQKRTTEYNAFNKLKSINILILHLACIDHCTRSTSYSRCKSCVRIYWYNQCKVTSDRSEAFLAHAWPTRMTILDMYTII